MGVLIYANHHNHHSLSLRMIPFKVLHLTGDERHTPTGHLIIQVNKEIE